MIVFKNLNLVKSNSRERVDIARQINLTISRASSLTLVFGSKEEIKEFSLGLSSFGYRDDYTLSGQYLIDNRDLANPLIMKNRGELESQVLVVSPTLLDVFNPSLPVKKVLRFLLKQRGGVLPDSLQDELKFLGLPESYLTTKIGNISQFQKVKLLLLITMLLQVTFLIFESADTELDDTELAEMLRIVQQWRVNTGLCCLFLSTDFAWALESSDAVGVMQAGLLLEYGSSIELSRRALHPMTLAMKREQFASTSAPLGCPYSSDCEAKHRVSENLCITTLPTTLSITDTHVIRCHLSAEERALYFSEVNSGLA